MEEYRVLKKVKLNKSHFPIGKAKHVVKGEEIIRPYELIIAEYDGDDGCYLFYMDFNGSEITDTFHTSMKNALKQAEWEFGVKACDWTSFPSTKDENN